MNSIRAVAHNDSSADNKHELKVAHIIAQLSKRRSTSSYISIKKKEISHQVPKAFDKKYTDDKIDISDLNDIICIDSHAMTCIAKSGVAFFDLVNATIQYGLVPMVVPEMKSITIGGAVIGCSLESTSFKYGSFHDTCLEYEFITAKGEVLICTPDNEYSFLFQMIHGSFGTLGILSLLKFKLIPIKPYGQDDV